MAIYSHILIEENSSLQSGSIVLLSSASYSGIIITDIYVSNICLHTGSLAKGRIRKRGGAQGIIIYIVKCGERGWGNLCYPAHATFLAARMH